MIANEKINEYLSFMPEDSRISRKKKRVKFGGRRMENRCLSCGEIIPEGREICYNCEYDVINRPAHYIDGKIEVIDFIEDKKLGFCLGNAIKYISRAGKKDPTKIEEDLKKAIWYINRRIEELKGTVNID